MRYERTSHRLLLFVLLIVLAATACRAATGMSQMIGDKPQSLPDLVGGILVRSADLNFITEQDSEVFVFYRNTQVEELTDQVFLQILRRPAETRIVSQPWSDFFAIRTRNDPTGRWKKLQEYLEANLTNLVIFRITRDAPYDAQYDLYAVGIFNGKTVVGVQMFGVAT